MTNNNLKAVVAVLALALGGFLLAIAFKDTSVKVADNSMNASTMDVQAEYIPKTQRMNILELPAPKNSDKMRGSRPISSMKDTGAGKAKSNCAKHTLEQGGSPEHSTVLVCE